MSNKIPCGGFYLDDMLSVNDSGELSINGGTPYQQLVTDGEGKAKWEDRLAYEDNRLVIDGGGPQFVKVSDEVPSWVSTGASMRVWTHYSDGGETNQVENVSPFGDEGFFNSAGFFAMTDNVEFIVEDINLVCPEKGVYLFSVPNNLYISGIASADSDTPEITWDGNIETIKTIDPKYIPSELNEIIVPSSTPSSTKKFKITVNDNGAISATEVT